MTQLEMVNQRLIGTHLRKLLRERLMTMKDFSILVNMNYTTIQRIANADVSMDLQTFAKICDGLGLTMKEFLEDLEAELDETGGATR